MRSPCSPVSVTTPTMTDTTLTPMNLSALRHLQRGMQVEFTENLRVNEELMDVILKAAAKHVAEQVPFTNQEAAEELTQMLATNVVITFTGMGV